MFTINPFETEPMAKIAVKISIMRVVKFMSSPGNDFTSWQKCQQLLFRGQSGDLPLSLHWFHGLPPGGCRGLSMSEICSENSETFDVWRTLEALVSKVTWIGSPMQVRSWDPGVLWCHTHPRCCPANIVRDGQSKLEKGQFLVCGWGGSTQCPAAPYNPH